MFDTFSARSSCRAARLSAASFASFLAVVLMVLPSARADVYWSATSGDWSVGSNWGGTLPSGGVSAWIINGGTANVTQLGETCGTLSLGGSAGSGTVQMASGNLSSTAIQYVGNSGSGVFMQSGGNNTVGSQLDVGYGIAATGTYELGGNAKLQVTQGEVIGLSGNGMFIQSGGSNTTSSRSGVISIGFEPGSNGIYFLNSGYIYAYSGLEVGYQGTGVFTQSGGTNYSAGTLIVGLKLGSTGTYNLSGGQLSGPSGDIEVVGSAGTGVFNQTGGTNSLAASDVLVGNGTYNLGGTGVLNACVEELNGGTANFNQSGGSNSAGWLYVGYSNGGSNSFSLSGTAQLSAGVEYVGNSPDAPAPGSFQQTGGTNAVSLLSISGSGSYLLTGGSLHVTGGFPNLGIFDGGNMPATLSADCLLDLTIGTWQNMKMASVSMGPNSLLIVPAGFSPSASFATFSTLGLTHTLGTTLMVPAGQGFCGSDTISDSVNCQGTIAAVYPGSIYLSGGLVLSGTGSINLGGGDLTTNDPQSTMSGGSLSVTNHYVGNGGTGAFTQSGGTNSISQCLYLGFNPGDSGTYNLSGSGQISAASYEYIGFSGTGLFTQSGGTNSLGNVLYLGNNAGSYGMYGLSGSGLLSTNSETVGYFGAGIFTQSGGSNSINGFLYLSDCSGSSGNYSLSGSGRLFVEYYEYVGYAATGFFSQAGGTNSAYALDLGGSGTYNLSGGLLIVSSLGQGSWTSTFNFSGGTLQASSGFSTSLPMTLGTAGGGATIDTAGYSVTLCGSLSGFGGLTKVDSGALTLATPNTYSGNTLITGGTLVLADPGAMQDSTLDTSGSGLLSFGSLISANFGGLTGPGGLSLANASSGAVALSVGNNGANTIYSGTLNGPGSLTKVGSGALLLSGSSTYTGGTTVNQGNLAVNGALVSPVTVNGSGILSGTGNLSSVTVAPSGQIAPGNPLGAMNVSGSLNLESGAVMDYDLDTPSTSSEVSMPTGELILSGQQFSDFTFAPTPNFGPGTYDLIGFETSSGSLGSDLSGTIDGLPATLSVSNNDLVLTVVPEPSTAALLGAGVLGLLGLAWRRRESKIIDQPGSEEDAPAILIFAAITASRGRMPSSLIVGRGKRSFDRKMSMSTWRTEK